MKNIYSIKQILLTNQNWFQFFEKHKQHIRPAIVTNVVKLLSCKNNVRGCHEYHCSNPSCTHIKRVPHTCKSKACSSCGKKATELWIQKQNQLLPRTAWQHITFTMPSELWDFFWCNRFLFQFIAYIAANIIKKFSKKRHAIPGIFIAIHTFGRDLKRNVHIHLSVSLEGLALDGYSLKKLYFKQTALMKCWRYDIIQLFRQQTKNLTIPPAIQKQFHATFSFNQFLDQLYRKQWIVHCSKPSIDHTKNVNYLARYVKRPAIAEAKLRHFDGNSVTFKYLDHVTKKYKSFILTAEQFIARFIQHIPDQGFRMIRYYGFLSHRMRGKLLPRVNTLLGQKDTGAVKPPTYAELIQKNFQFDPFTCILCGQPMILSGIVFGKTALNQLMKYHTELALLQKI